jgi:hypothetical protein
MASFILLLHEEPSTFSSLSPQQMQNIIQEYMAWSDAMRKKGVLKRGIKLEDGAGRTVKGSVVTDGPYSEAKEVIGGIFELEAETYDAAAELAKTCPHAKYGVVEIRRVEIG